MNGEDILFAMTSLGFENYGEALKIYLARFREVSVPRCNFSPPTQISFIQYILLTNPPRTWSRAASSPNPSQAVAAFQEAKALTPPTTTSLATLWIHRPMRHPTLLIRLAVMPYPGNFRRRSADLSSVWLCFVLELTSAMFGWTNNDPILPPITRAGGAST